MIGQHSRRHGRGFRILEWVALLSLLGLQAARAQDEGAPTTTLSAPDVRSHHQSSLPYLLSSNLYRRGPRTSDMLAIADL